MDSPAAAGLTQAMSTPNPPGFPGGPPPEGWQRPGYLPPPGPPMPPQAGYPGYPPQPGYVPPQPGSPPSQPYPGYGGYPGVDPHAPFGRDPATGVALSDKSGTTAGLLQLFFGVFGIGRFYIDSTQIAVAQLILGLVGLVFSLFCFIALPVLLGSAVWAVVDAIMMFTGSVKDSYGRKLR
ncbi:TM2 domain-containing protein [Mycobacterium ahvazicum]|uniref:TM2 domain-containing protein n=2 Tax=Mycobacterium ahvazicum TaxID=1964395 RepID=A0A2K4YIC1_9MYCO|nr:TM2 domain-containing protein [Mycobacterium ahvazicum]SOX56534.1 TM2 domain-containing protein [Mycobacterium ahvazicum]